MRCFPAISPERLGANDDNMPSTVARATGVGRFYDSDNMVQTWTADRVCLQKDGHDLDGANASGYVGRWCGGPAGRTHRYREAFCMAAQRPQEPIRNKMGQFATYFDPGRSSSFLPFYFVRTC